MRPWRPSPPPRLGAEPHAIGQLDGQDVIGRASVHDEARGLAADRGVDHGRVGRLAIGAVKVIGSSKRIVHGHSLADAGRLPGTR